MKIESGSKANFIKDYWPQLTSIVVVLLLLGQMYSDFNTLKQELVDAQRVQESQWRIFNEKIDKTISILNDEDDGVRGDFGVGDQNLKENIKSLQKYEELRALKDRLEMKVWHYEQHNK